MSRTSFVPRPPGSRFAVLHEHYVRACGGNACGALLLDVFETWTMTRLRDQEQDGGNLWIYRSMGQLVDEDLCGAFGKDAVSAALDRLIHAGLVKRRRNPHNGWDRKWQYRLDLETLAAICGFPPIDVRLPADRSAESRQAIQNNRKNRERARSAESGTRRRGEGSSEHVRKLLGPEY